jgi:acetate kinase
MNVPIRVVLAINAGSSSLKFALHPCHGMQATAPVLSGVIEGLEPGGQPLLRLRTTNAAARDARLPPGDGDPFERALRLLRTTLDQHVGADRLAAVAHRIVHGGERHAASIVLDDQALSYLDSLAPLAPLHQPHNVAAVRACRRAYPDVPQIGCFDTGFHATLPPEEQLFALPQALRAAGVRRYGFHGLSYRYVAARLALLTERSGGRVLMAHLGNGASVCAMRAGASIATSMGFSALDGLMMGTRSGAVDPGVLLYLLQDGWSPQRIEHLLYRESGLLGVSGLSADMRTLRVSDTPGARQAIALFEHRLVRECGALAATLEGIDVLAFTGGIGEHDAALRQQACARLRHLGVVIAPQRNLLADGSVAQAIHAADSAVEVWVVPTDEGRVAAADAARLVGVRE